MRATNQGSVSRPRVRPKPKPGGVIGAVTTTVAKTPKPKPAPSSNVAGKAVAKTVRKANTRKAGRSVSSAVKHRTPGYNPFGHSLTYREFLRANYEHQKSVAGPVRDAAAKNLGLKPLKVKGKWDGYSYVKPGKDGPLGIGPLGTEDQAWDPATNSPDTKAAERALRADPKQPKFAVQVQGVKGMGDSAHAAGDWVLHQVSRPIHGIAATANAVAHGADVGQAAQAGVREATSKSGGKTTFSDVLKTVGAPKIVQGVGGFVLDVGLDPLTYVTFGEASVARVAAESAARKAAAAAVRDGATHGAAVAAAKRAAQDAALKARRRGASRVEQDAAASGAASKAAHETVAARVETAKGRAARKASAAAPAGRGVTVKVAGVAVPGVTRATAKVGRGVRRSAAATVGRSGRVRRAGGMVRDTLTELRPQMRPTGASEAEFQGTRSANRTARATERSLRLRADQTALNLHKVLKPEEYAVVIRAVESGSHIGRVVARAVRSGEVPAGREQVLVRAAHDVRSANRGASRALRQSGAAAADVRRPTEVVGVGGKARPHSVTQRVDVAAGEAKGYVSHKMPSTKEAKVERGPRRGPGTPKVRTVDSGKHREDRRPLHVQNAERAQSGDPLFSENLPHVQQQYGHETAVRVAQGQHAQDIAATGRQVRIKNGKPVDAAGKPVTMGEHDSLYLLGRKDGKYGLHPVKDASPNANGRYVVLNTRSVNHAIESTAPLPGGTMLGRGIDSATAKWKVLATGTPGFYIRNLLGEHWFAYTQIPGLLIPKYEARAMAILKELGRQERHVGGRPLAKSKTTIKVRGQEVSVTDVADALRRHGGVRTGFIARDVGDALVKPPRKVRVKGSKAGASVKRGVWNIEDIGRVMSSLYHYDHAPTVALGKRSIDHAAMGEAVGKALDRAHIDYGDLTAAERRGLKRAFPFYTFNARTVPNTAKLLVQKPGKFANFEMAREEIAKATGVDPEQVARDANAWQQRSLGFPAKIAGSASMVDWGTPAQALNELPMASDFKTPAEYGKELVNFLVGMGNPLFKVPLELAMNYNTFFRAPIDRVDPKTGVRLVPAPWFAQAVWEFEPAAAKVLFGAEKYKDKTGKEILGINPNVDYAMRGLLPGLFNQFSQLTQQTENRTNMGVGSQWFRLASGIKVSKVDPSGASRQQLYDRYRKNDERMQYLRKQKGVNADRPNAEYSRLLKEQAALGVKLGMRKPPKVKAKNGVAPPPPGNGGVPLPPAGGNGGVPPPPS